MKPLFLIPYLTATTLAFLLAWPLISHSQTITAENYVAMDLQLRQLTIKGIKQRLKLLQQNAAIEQQYDLDNTTQQQVNSLYQQYGMTPASAMTWASQNQAALTDWLAAHPQQQTQYQRLAHQLETLSSQIQYLTNQ